MLGTPRCVPLSWSHGLTEEMRGYFAERYVCISSMIKLSERSAVEYIYDLSTQANAVHFTAVIRPRLFAAVA